MGNSPLLDGLLMEWLPVRFKLSYQDLVKDGSEGSISEVTPESRRVTFRPGKQPSKASHVGWPFLSHL